MTALLEKSAAAPCAIPAALHFLTVKCCPVNRDKLMRVSGAPVFKVTLIGIIARQPAQCLPAPYRCCAQINHGPTPQPGGLVYAASRKSADAADRSARDN
jgi:hypothetical protein